MLPGTPKVVKCSVGQRLETDCGLCSRYPSMKECMPILACKRDIQVHLQHLNLSRQAVASEGDLILLRLDSIIIFRFYYYALESGSIRGKNILFAFL